MSGALKLPQPDRRINVQADQIRLFRIIPDRARFIVNNGTEQRTLYRKIRRSVGIAAQRSREGHLPFAAQMLEMLVLRLFRGIPPGYYQRAGFWRREIPFGDKLNHLGQRAFVRRVDTLNPPAYRKLSHNKLAEKAILQLMKIPTPRFIGHLDRHRGRSAYGSPLRSVADLENVLRRAQARRVCFKELEGWGGRNFLAVECVTTPTQGLTLRSMAGGNSWELPRFSQEVLKLGTGQSWLVEEYFEQHERLRALNPSSLNTLRIWLCLEESENPRVIGAKLRIGRQGSLVDNTSAQGLVSVVDSKTGRLDYAIDAEPERNIYSTHPDHGAQIADIVVPFWREACDLAGCALKAFPRQHFAGLDVAIGPSGPAVIELNLLPDLIGASTMNIKTAVEL